MVEIATPGGHQLVGNRQQGSELDQRSWPASRKRIRDHKLRKCLQKCDRKNLTTFPVHLLQPGLRTDCDPVAGKLSEHIVQCLSGFVINTVVILDVTDLQV